MPTTAEALTSHPFGRGEFDPFKTQYFDFVDLTDDGGPDRSLHPGIDFGPWLFCLNITPSVLIGDVDAQPFAGSPPVPVSNFLCPAHGLLNGDQIRFDTDGMLPIGIFLATYYFVVNATTDTFQVSTTSGGSAVSFSDAGSGHINVTKRGLPFDFTGATPYAWVKLLPTDPDGSKLLDLAPTIVSPATLGTIQIFVTGAASNTLVSANAFWNLIVKLTGLQKLNLVRGQFDIVQLPTHPFP
jgi:hypothetical protein